MSRGFVKEEDQEEAPFIPPRAPLPEGIINYVTPRGLALLHQEREALEKQRTELIQRPAEAISDQDRRRELVVINGQLDLLNERLATARVVEPGETSNEEVRFGTTVTYDQAGTQRTFTIVGADEANVKQGRIAFTSPIARALMGSKVGDSVDFQLGGRTQKLRVLKIAP